MFGDSFADLFSFVAAAEHHDEHDDQHANPDKWIPPFESASHEWISDLSNGPSKGHGPFHAEANAAEDDEFLMKVWTKRDIIQSAFLVVEVHDEDGLIGLNIINVEDWNQDNKVTPGDGDRFTFAFFSFGSV